MWFINYTIYSRHIQLVHALLVYMYMIRGFCGFMPCSPSLLTTISFSTERSDCLVEIFSINTLLTLEDTHLKKKF